MVLGPLLACYRKYKVRVQGWSHWHLRRSGLFNETHFNLYQSNYTLYKRLNKWLTWLNGSDSQLFMLYWHFHFYCLYFVSKWQFTLPLLTKILDREQTRHLFLIWDLENILGGVFLHSDFIINVTSHGVISLIRSERVNKMKNIWKCVKSLHTEWTSLSL